MVTELLFSRVINAPPPETGPIIGPKIVRWKLLDDGTVRETAYDPAKTADLLGRVSLDGGETFLTPADGALFLTVAAGLLGRQSRLAMTAKWDDRPAPQVWAD
jgi:hypothetical protein